MGSDGDIHFDFDEIRFISSGGQVKYTCVQGVIFPDLSSSRKKRETALQ